jgi:polyisoprenoid-binding protein YceI
MKIRTSVLALAAFAAGLTSTASAAVESYTIDSTHSSVQFSLRHLVSKFTGSFSTVSGTIAVDRANLEKSSVEATIDIGSINTADEKRNNHLKASDFFDFAKFPSMKFKSTAWKKTGTDAFDVTGNLTIKDVTKPVVLKVKLLGFGDGMAPGTQVSGWEITSSIKKSEFGLAGPAMLGKALGDDVAISIGIEAGAKK